MKKFTQTRDHPFSYYSGTISIHSGTGVLSAGGSGGVVHSTDISASGNFTDVFQFTTEPLMPNVEQDLHIAIAARTGKFLLMLVDTVTNNTIATLQLAASANPDTVTFHFTPTAERLTVMGGPLTGGVSTIELAGYYTYTVTTVPHTVVTSVCSNDEYRYGYNGQMKVNEWAGLGNHTTALFWEYDSRIARRLNQDPILHPSISPYSTLNNNPIMYFDIYGNDTGSSGSGAGGADNTENWGNTLPTLYVVAKRPTQYLIKSQSTDHQNCHDPKWKNSRRKSDDDHDERDSGEFDGYMEYNSHGADAQDNKKNPYPGRHSQMLDIGDILKAFDKLHEFFKNKRDPSNQAADNMKKIQKNI